MEQTTSRSWLRDSSRPQCEKFICSYCNKTVRYKSLESYGRKAGVVKNECEYNYCPWCGKKML